MKPSSFVYTVLLALSCFFAVASNAYGQESTVVALLDTESSSIKWVGKKVAGQHSGTVKLKSGSIHSVGDQIKNGQFTIDMNSIANDDIESKEYRNKLESHLKADDFFSVAKFPDANFELTSVKPVENTKTADDYTVIGKLSIKGISQEIQFPATITRTDNGQYKASAKLTIDRLKWDIRYNSKKFFDVKALGDKLIYDDIEIELNLKTK